MTADALAPNDLVAAVRPWVHRLAGRHARRLRLDRDDLAQSVFLRLLETAHGHDPARGAPTTFAYYTALSVAARVNEREHRHRLPARLDAPTADGTDLDVPGREVDPLDAAERADSLARLRRGLAQLGDEDAAILRMRFGLDGAEPMKFAEIGVALGTTRDRAGTLVERAVDRLRAVMTEIVMTDASHDRDGHDWRES